MIGLKPPLYGRSRLLNLYQPKAGDGCVLWLPGQDDAYSATIRDRSGLNNNGTITGATWARLPSGLWYSYHDGTDDYVTITDSNNILNFTSEDFSILAWVRLDNIASTYAIFGRGIFGATGDGYIFLITTSFLRFDTYQAGSVYQRTDSSSGDIVTGQWSLVVVTRKGASARLYKNAVDVSSVIGTHINPASSTRTARFGIRDDLIQDFIGGIALPRIFNRQLLAPEILTFYQQERHFFGI